MVADSHATFKEQVKWSLHVLFHYYYTIPSMLLQASISSSINVPSHLIATYDSIETSLSSLNFTMPSKILQHLPFIGVKCPIYFPPGSISREICSSVTFSLKNLLPSYGYQRYIPFPIEIEENIQKLFYQALRNLSKLKNYAGIFREHR